MKLIHKFTHVQVLRTFYHSCPNINGNLGKRSGQLSHLYKFPNNVSQWDNIKNESEDL